MADDSERLELPTAGGAVSALWTPAARAIAVAAIAHGAGAGMTHPFMTGAAAGLAGGGVSVLRFNFLYMEARRRVPDRTPVLLDTWRAMIRELAAPRRRAPDGHGREVHGRPHGVHAGRGGGCGVPGGGAGVLRIPAASSRGDRPATGCAPRGDPSADAVHPGYAGRARASRPDRGRGPAPRTAGPAACGAGR